MPSKNYRDRKIDKRNPKKTILIVCEGAKTEPNYFNKFKEKLRLTSVRLEVYGEGANTNSLVEIASRRQKEALSNNEPYDSVWCVFDRDSFPSQNFNDALEKAKFHNLSVAYSNEAFEIWYLLHFNYYDTRISRADYCEKLSELITSKYTKNSADIYEKLLSKQGDAIRNAKKLLENYNPTNPEQDNPSTTVHILVEELNSLAES